METTINGNTLLGWGLPQNEAISLALKLVSAITKEEEIAAFKAQVEAVIAHPDKFKEDATYSDLAQAIMRSYAAETVLRENPVAFEVFGAENIEAGAVSQMTTAARLPIAVAGALMPDAHHGYGLPIGGVLATRGAIIPYGVGVDIGCRMSLSIFDVSEASFRAAESQFKRELVAHTLFGAGAGFRGQYASDHEVLSRREFNTIKVVKDLYDKAAMQLGSSGGGNHFVEWGFISFGADDPQLGVPAGSYLALLSHSGSRGLGATLAGHYTRLAKQLCPLPKEAANLAYLDLNSEAGIEYWLAMNLAGDYAAACHDVIHAKLTKAIRADVLAKVENHHNFAWKEVINGEELIVHRKGATPASAGVYGIIPGSMTAPGFLVKGKGNERALYSASHGAGRQMSRTKATQSITRNELHAVLKHHGVSLIGGGLDEAPMAYKDIHGVMAAQTDLVETIATFRPVMVRMADDGSRED